MKRKPQFSKSSLSGHIQTFELTSWGIPASRNCSDSASLCSTLVVPTSTGLPILCILEISTTTALHFPEVARKTTSESSWKKGKEDDNIPQMKISHMD